MKLTKFLKTACVHVLEISSGIRRPYDIHQYPARSLPSKNVPPKSRLASAPPTQHPKVLRRLQQIQ
ncbi:hypothetical protein HYC85_030982 [Camellia sinensis]|uniref:Uncharacterized protein n=1 Tax=Camellia sinensis TaxID=4442 RepID=A0A7J7FPT5_CAMSI|nr:hypothetical protein HYC85_030982 [Camellia sinensis]